MVVPGGLVYEWEQYAFKIISLHDKYETSTVFSLVPVPIWDLVFFVLEILTSKCSCSKG